VAQAYVKFNCGQAHDKKNRSRVSADISQEQKTGTTYYMARLSVGEEQIARLNGLNLGPGMPVEAFIQTGERTAIS
jgi:membrane fusion protein, type I secretion system